MNKNLLILFYLCLAKFSFASEKPNFILIFTDDQGYGDLGCYGSNTIRTPHLDRLAREGRRFTSFLSGSSICTPSRAALLTGCYPKRISMHQGVLSPSSKKGLNPEEYTIADHFSRNGYATACIGKWHLGHLPEVLPRAHGFDSYYGIPYSNDMNHPNNEGKPEGGHKGMDVLWNDPGSTLTKWQTPLMENEAIIEIPVDQRTITRRSTDRGIDFIKRNQTQPFFLYLPYSMPHIPLYVPDDIRDPDPQRAYINTIEHLDTELGRIFDTIRELKLSENTFIIFTSDNGPWLPFKHHAGSAGSLRDGKFSCFEGGYRIPCIMWAPGRIPAGSECHSLSSTIDLLPSFAKLMSSPLPADREIDGLDISPLILGDADSIRNEFLYYSSAGEISGIRVDNWKLLILRSDPNSEKKHSEQTQTLLFNITEDIGETLNLAAENPTIVEKLHARMLESDKAISAKSRPAWTNSLTH